MLLGMLQDKIEYLSKHHLATNQSMDIINHEIQSLKNQIDQQNHTIYEQQKLLEVQVKNSSQSFLDLEKMEKEKKLLEIEMQKLEEDRAKFTDAAIKLGLERANLQVTYS